MYNMFYDGIQSPSFLKAPDRDFNNLQFLGVGHSYIFGTVSGLGVTGNSYRREMYYRARTHYGKNWIFVGSQTGGDIIPAQYHEGWAAKDSAWFDTYMDGYLDNAFPIPTCDDCVILGPLGFADCLNEVPLATFNANVDSMINKIHNHGACIKIFLVTDPYCPYSFPPGQDINDYADEVETAYNDAKAAGKNVFLIDANSQSINIGTDNIHPDWLGYEQLGEYITDQVASHLGIPQINLVTLFSDVFTDTDNVLLKNHTPNIDVASNGWEDSNDRCEILNNYCHEINTVDFRDALYDTERVVGTFRFKLYQSANGNVYVVLKANSGSSQHLFMFLNATTNILQINSQGGIHDSASFTNSLSTWYEFKAVIRGNSIEIFDHLDNSIIHTPVLSHGNNTRIGVGGYTLGTRYVDDYVFESYQI